MQQDNRLKHLAKTLLQRLSGGRFVYRIPDRSSLYMTFDDGPDERYTPAVLDVLRRHGAKATFFLVGTHVAQHPELVRALREQGHTVGLHTHTHRTMDRMSHAEFDREIELNQSAIQEAIDSRPTLLRPPEGRLTFNSLLWAVAKGLRVIHYTVTSNDWKATSSEEITELFANVDVHGGEILSFHDNNPFTVEAVQALIERYTRAGFQFRSISS
jgi:peptidoglycan/xylan/chitin deacetylase (PgdA/CDA1 family)